MDHCLVYRGLITLGFLIVQTKSEVMTFSKKATGTSGLILLIMLVEICCTGILRAHRLFCERWLRPRGGRPRLIIIHEYAVTLGGLGFGRVAEVAETQVLEARLACEGRLWMNHREIHEVWTLLD